MKQLCLDCFINGRVKVLVNGQCQDCGCRKAVIGIKDSKLAAIWPENAPEPICVEHKNPELFQ